MNDAQRWRIVADWFDEAARTGDFTDDRVQSGLCSALVDLDRQPTQQARLLCTRIVQDATGRCFHPHDYRTREGAGWRACLALLLAHDAEDTGGNHREDA